MAPQLDDIREEGDYSHAETDDDDLQQPEQAKPKRNNKDKDNTIAASETRAVTIIRIITLMVLVCSALVTTFLVYAYAADQEDDDFEQAFFYDASKVLETYQANAAQRIKALDSFSTSITQFVVSRQRFEQKMQADREAGMNVPSPPPGHGNTSFPTVTVPEFERAASYTLESAEVLGLMFLPVVQVQDKADWEAYSVQNVDWLTESLAFQQEKQQVLQNEKQQQQHMNNVNGRRQLQEQGSKTNTNNDDTEWQPRISHVIIEWNTDGTSVVPATGPGPFYPVWQMAPALNMTSLLNYNMGQYFATEFAAVQATQRPLTTLAAQLDTTKTDFAVAQQQDRTDLLQQSGITSSSTTTTTTTPQEDTSPDGGLVDGGSFLLKEFVSKASQLDPEATSSIEQGGGITSNLIVPVFDVWNQENRQVTGVLFVMVYWQRYLDYLLPDVSETLQSPLVAVLENTCNQAFTYEIRGSQATFLGVGDLHDDDYDELMMESGFAAVLGFELAQDEALPGECLYNVRVYPTEEMEENFLTNEPYWFAAIVLFIFIFTAAVFVCYDRLVQRRHHVVNTKAVESSAVVSSLFPEAVREQVVGIVEKCNTEPSRDFSMASAAGGSGWEKTPTKAAAAAATSGGSYYDRLAAELDSSAPIANLYPDCTVLFCDIAGFTAWSGQRGPSEVFKLLEAIYGSFDRIAKKKQVFKVETIGDCYVAVTGLPQPQALHAVIMTKFANDCMTALSGMMHVLVDKLGEDTANLTMRFGLHSGPVTAGVLRGERARFQLFGDTVNTASRMESNGQKGRIQVSQQTADLLIAAGKQHWVKPREDKIQAKGKGLLQTYWVEVNSMTTSSSSSGTPRTASLTNSLPDVGDTVELMGEQAVELSRQQHKEYRDIIHQIKQEVSS